MISSVQNIKGYSVLPILLPENKATSSKTYHYIYIKKHTSTSSSSSSSNTDSHALFIVNLPQNTSLKQIKKLFQDISIGAIVKSFTKNENYNLMDYSDDINLTELTNDGLPLSTVDSNAIKLPIGCGVVEFLDKDGLNLALNGIKKLITSKNVVPPTWDFSRIDNGTGENRYRAKYSSLKLNQGELSIEVAKFMNDFQNAERSAREELNNMKDLVDEDGFTLVVGSQRKTKQSIMGSLKKLTEIENEKNMAKMKKKEKVDFYRFQIREKKKEEMNELLNKFKQDQERVKQMKEKRKFKPY